MPETVPSHGCARRIEGTPGAGSGNKLGIQSSKREVVQFLKNSPARFNPIALGNELVRFDQRSRANVPKHFPVPGRLTVREINRIRPQASRPAARRTLWQLCGWVEHLTQQRALPNLRAPPHPKSWGHWPSNACCVEPERGRGVPPEWRTRQASCRVSVASHEPPRRRMGHSVQTECTSTARGVWRTCNSALLGDADSGAT